MDAEHDVAGLDWRIRESARRPRLDGKYRRLIETIVALRELEAERARPRRQCHDRFEQSHLDRLWLPCLVKEF